MDDMASALSALGLTRGNGQNSRALLAAASAGTITTLECAMPECVCPEGRGYFEPVGHRSPWAPSADRWPRAARGGGTYAVDNVRLAHRRCNTLDGTRITQEHLRANGYYGSPKHRETGRRLGLGRREGMREWWKTPEGQAVRQGNSERLRKRMASRTPEKRAEAGRRLNAARDPAATAEAARSNILSAHIALAERRKDPQVRAALVESGRQLGKEHGSAALRRFRETPEARELERISGKRLAALARERARTGYFKSPERVAVRAQSGRIGTCQRWNLDRGKPCVCGVHVGTA